MVTDRIDATGDRQGRLSGLAFGTFGAALVLAGALSIATGVPSAARDLRPVGGLGDVTGRLGELLPLFSAVVAALVAASVAVLLATRKLRPSAASLELIVLGVAIEVCVLGAAGRIGYATDGSVLVAAVACLSGGVAVLAAGVVTALTGE
jgi:hypothetical protein